MLGSEEVQNDYGQEGKPGRKGRRRKAKTVKEFKLDKESKRRIRKTPEILEFYQFVKRYNLRDEAFKSIVLSGLNEMDSRKVRKMLLAKPNN